MVKFLNYRKWKIAIEKSGLFDIKYYLFTYPDVRINDHDPIMHYLKFGASEGRNPSSSFNTNDYFQYNEGIGNSNPLIHYIEYLQTQKHPLKYSIIMPTWNRRDIISSAIDSVLKQSYSHWELIIVDDQSTDGTLAYLQKKYKKQINQKVIRLYENPDKGVSSARNYGLKQVSGDIVSYLDSDNFWKKTYLEEVNTVYKQYKKIDTVYTAIYVLDKDNDESFIRDINYNRKNILRQNFIDLNIFSHRSKLITQYGIFNTVMSRLVDYELIIRYTRNKEPYYLNKALATYIFDKSNNQISNNECYDFNSKVFKEINKEELKKYNLLTKENCFSIEQKVELNTSRNKQIVWHAKDKRVQNRISIIIPVYNNIEYTKKCISSIIDKTSYIDYEIIIVDNHSIDDTMEWFYKKQKELPSFVKYFRNDFNYGYSVGNNIGVSYSTGQYVLLLNNDIEILTPKWLEIFIDNIQDKSIGIIGPKLLYPDMTIQCAGIAFNNINCMPYHIFQGLPYNDPLVNRKRILKATTGACMFMRADDYIEVNGLSTDYLNGGEDVDLCFKLHDKLGLKIQYTPEIEIVHYESKSEGRFIAIEFNRQVLYNKWLQKLQPRDDMIIYAQDDIIIDEYKRNTNDINSHTALYLPKFIKKPPFFLKKENTREITSIIIFKPSGIGNMIMFTPTLTALKKQFNTSKFTIACYSAEADIVRDKVDQILLLNKNPETGACDKKQIDNIIKQGDYELAIYPQFTNFGNPTKYLKAIIPYHIFFKPVDYTVKHEVLHNMDVAYKLGWKEDVPEMWTPIDTEMDIDKNVYRGITIHVGASEAEHMQKKKWPEHKWVELLNRLPKDTPIIFVGGRNEKHDIDTITAKLKNNRLILRFDGQINLKQTASIINASQLMISTDSGLMHMAAALKKPLVALFGPTLLSKNSAWGNDTDKIHIMSKTECAPCYADPKKLFECQDPICMQEISVDEVFNAITDLIELDRKLL